MSKLVAAIFADEATANEGARVLKALHSRGSISLSGMAVLVNNAATGLSLTQLVDEKNLGLWAGALVGGLAGSVGGPGGAALGAVAGALVGWTADQTNESDRVKFMHNISRKLSPGSTAVLAEVTEYSENFIDAHLEAVGGAIVRD